MVYNMFRFSSLPTRTKQTNLPGLQSHKTAEIHSPGVATSLHCTPPLLQQSRCRHASFSTVWLRCGNKERQKSAKNMQTEAAEPLKHK